MRLDGQRHDGWWVIGKVLLDRGFIEFFQHFELRCKMVISI